MPPQKSSSINDALGGLDGWLKAQEQLYGVDAVEPGFESIKQIAKKINRSISAAKTLVAKLRESGQVETKRFYLKDQFGRQHLCPHYRIIPPSHPRGK